MSVHGLQPADHHQVRIGKEISDVDIYEVPQALLLADGLGNMDLPGINDGAARAAEGDDLPVHIGKAAAPLALSQLDEVMVVHRLRFQLGIVGE